MFKNIVRPIAILTLGLTVAAHAALAGSEPIQLEGAIGRATVGGVETPLTQGYTIGRQTFVVDGPMAPAIEAVVGQHLQIKGMLIHHMAIGCEAVPTLRVGEMALAHSDMLESPIRIDGNVKRDRSAIQVGARKFVPAGPLAAALLALDGLAVEITGAAKPAIAAVESIYVTSIGKRDLTKGAVILPIETLLESVTTDAIGRYSLENPGTPAGTPDGTSPRVKSADFDKATRLFHVVVETFGGFAGISLGHSVEYIYDERGKLLESRVA